jgi:phenylalanine-4-hydroxylase
MFLDLDAPRPPQGAAADWTVPQKWERFGAADHATWDLLFDRQRRALQGRAVRAFDEGIELLGLDTPGIPRFDRLNETLGARTGWEIVPVPGLVPDRIFFDHLSRRRFPAGNFIRSADRLDYLEEPDVFHDVFGHVPMLADPAFADLMQALGKLGLEADRWGLGDRLARLYWYTIEFGLAREDGALKIYGAGIASSFGESVYALESDVPERARFDLTRVLETPYRSDVFQPLYFVLDDMADLLGIAERAEVEALGLGPA